jgi:hypothetical protein
MVLQHCPTNVLLALLTVVPISKYRVRLDQQTANVVRHPRIRHASQFVLNERFQDVGVDRHC